MKNKIKKAEMRGQFIDMQPTRGGIPSRLIPSPVTRYDLDRIGVRYVIGRIGWIACKRPKPKDWIFIHKTDESKVSKYMWCMRKLDLYADNPNLVTNYNKQYFQHCVYECGFKFQRKYAKMVKEILNWTFEP